MDFPLSVTVNKLSGSVKEGEFLHQILRELLRRLLDLSESKISSWVPWDSEP
jgi:hypothetical protein